MSMPNSQVALTLALAGILFLRPSSLAPVKDAPSVLAADSLARAVVTGNPLLFDLCVAERIDVNGPDTDGRTPLLIATVQRDHAMIARLLQMGASVDLPDHSGRTPLAVVATRGEIDLLRSFASRSSLPNAPDAAGRTPLHHAIAARQFEAAETLLPLAPEFHAAPDGGRDLLALAYETADMRMITAILSRTPGPLAWTPETRRALSAAISSEASELVRLLLIKHPAPPTAEGHTVPLLAHAIVNDDAATLRALLRAGADPNTILPTPCPKDFVAQVASNYLRSYLLGDERVTLLMLAAGLGKAEYLRALLEAGADRNRITPKYKMLALYFAARTQNAKCVQILLGKGPTREELRVEISLATQRASVIKDGVAILQTPVSTGRKGFDTRPGEYVVTDKKRNHRSSIYHVEMPFFMRLNCLDFGLHAGNVPNYPASHGCIRLPAEFAQKLFSEIPVGTMVTIN